ncbi:MAG: selenocysteine-specific translation elongation factor [Nitriliruptoraceae bacterium]
MDHRVVVTAGHVDHGKSTLVRALTGMEPDRLAEERRRGLTIELGFAWGALARSDGTSRTVAFVDVPGHERFLATMLAGAGAAPAVLLVVAATDGWSAQTDDHVAAITHLAIPGVAIAVTKSTLVDDEWRRMVIDDIRARISGTTLADAPIVTVDAPAQHGVEAVASTIADRLDVLDEPVDHGRPRLMIDRVFTIGGAGTVVTGTSADGTFVTGSRVRVLPSGASGRVRGLESLGRPVERVGPGQRVAVNVAGIDRAAAARGAVLVDETPWPVTTRIDVTLESTIGDDIERGALHIHVGANHTTCRVRLLTASTARITTTAPVVVATGDRFVIRDVGRRALVAGGVVVDPTPVPVRGARARSAHGAALQAVLATDRRDWPTALATLAGGWRPLGDVVAATGHRRDEEACLGDAVVTADTRSSWLAVIEGLGSGTHHRENVASRLVEAGVPTALVGPLLDRAIEAGVLARVTGGFTLAPHQQDTQDERDARLEAFVDELDHQGVAPEAADTLCRRHGIDHRDVADLIERQRIVRVGDQLLSRAAVDRAADILRTQWPGGATFTAAAAKDAWQTTRKFAIPLLEHLDRIGVTAFDGTVRHITDAGDNRR